MASEAFTKKGLPEKSTELVRLKSGAPNTFDTADQSLSSRLANVRLAFEPAIPLPSPEETQNSSSHQRLRLSSPVSRAFSNQDIDEFPVTSEAEGSVSPDLLTTPKKQRRKKLLSDSPGELSPQEQESILSRFYLRIEKEKELTRKNGNKLGYFGETNAPTLEDYFDYCYEFRTHPLDFVDDTQQKPSVVASGSPSEFVRQASRRDSTLTAGDIPRMSSVGSIELTWRSPPKVGEPQTTEESSDDSPKFKSAQSQRKSFSNVPPIAISKVLPTMPSAPPAVGQTKVSILVTPRSGSEYNSPIQNITVEGSTPIAAPVTLPSAESSSSGSDDEDRANPSQPLLMKMSSGQQNEPSDTETLGGAPSDVPSPSIYSDIEGYFVVNRDVRDYFSKICSYRDIESIEAGAQREARQSTGTYFSSYSFTVHHQRQTKGAIFNETMLGRLFENLRSRFGSKKKPVEASDQEIEKLLQKESLLNMMPPTGLKNDEDDPTQIPSASFVTSVGKSRKTRLRPTQPIPPSPPLALLIGGGDRDSLDSRGAKMVSAGASAVPSFYGLTEFFDALTEFEDDLQIDLMDFLLLVRELFIWCLRKFGCDILEEISSDKSRIFVKARLKELPARRLANHLDYICQIHRNATSYSFLKEDDEYIPPYLPYDEHAENIRGGYYTVRNENLVWARFDGLNRPFLGRLQRLRVAGDGATAVAAREQSQGYKYPLNEPVHSASLPKSSEISAHEEPEVLSMKLKDGQQWPVSLGLPSPTSKKPKARKVKTVEELYRDARYLSIFRDADRIRLLNYVVSFHFNINIMSQTYWLSAPPSGIKALNPQYKHTRKIPPVLMSNFPIHKRPILVSLRRIWARLQRWAAPQPIEEIRNYFGEEVAFYFLWTRFFTDSLKIPAALGVIVYCLEWILDPNSEYNSIYVKVATFAYALYIVIWSSTFASNWTKEEKYWKLKWGMESERLSSRLERPDFVFDYYVVDSLNPKRFAKYYSPFKSKLRLFVSSAITLGSITLIIGAVVGIFAFRVVMDYNDQYFWWARGYEAAVISSVQAFQIVVMDYLWCRMVQWLTRFENHKHDRDHRSSFVLKMFIFRFTNNFYALLYIGFAKNYIDPCIAVVEGAPPDKRGCLPYLRLQIVVLYLFYAAFNAVEIAWPLTAFYLRQRAAKGKIMRPIQTQSYLLEYDPLTLIEDHLEIAIQYVAAVIFSVVMPLTPLLAYILNLSELRVDAFKLVTAHQRAYPSVAPHGLSTYNDIVTLVGLLALPANVAFCLFLIPMFDSDFSTSTKLLIFIIFEHALILLRIYVSVNRPVDSEKADSIRERMQLAVHDVVWGGSEYLEFEATSTGWGFISALGITDGGNAANVLMSQQRRRTAML